MTNERMRQVIRLLQDGFTANKYVAVPAQPELRTELIELLQGLMNGPVRTFADYVQLLNRCETDQGVEFQAAWGFRLVPDYPIDEVLANGFTLVDDAMLADWLICSAGLEALWNAWHSDSDKFVPDRDDD